MLIHRQRGNYWSCSKFANWILINYTGTPKPNAATMEDWGEWHRNAKQANKFAYWVADELLDDIQDVVNFPLDLFDAVRCRFLNQFVDKIHYLKTGLKPGEYSDVDHRILYALFNTLVDFIEIEKAYHSVIFCGDDELKEEFPQWYKKRWTRWGRFRSAKAGLKHLEWEIALTNDEDGTPTHQAVAAKEQLDLYNWWKNVRPARKEPYDDYLPAEDDTGDFMYRKRTEEDRARGEAAMKLEQQYSDEDDEMLVRLIKIRKSLWT